MLFHIFFFCSFYCKCEINFLSVISFVHIIFSLMHNFFFASFEVSKVLLSDSYLLVIIFSKKLHTKMRTFIILFLIKQKQFFLWASLRSKAHGVDFNTMIFRLSSVRKKEKIALKSWIHEKEKPFGVIIVHTQS